MHASRRAPLASDRDAAGVGLQDSALAWWRLAASLALSTMGGIGLWSVVVSLPAIQAEFGVDRGGASLPYTATMVGFAVGGVLMGRLADRFGVMAPAIVGTLMLGAGYVAAASAATLWQFLLAQALLIGMLGSSATFGPLVADVSLWFRRRRGIAVAIVASGNYLAGTIWPPALQAAIEAVGWRQAHIGIGVLCVLTMVPLALTLRRRAPVEDAGVPLSARDIADTLRLSPAALQVLLVIAGQDDGCRRQRIGEQAGLNAGARPSELLGHQRVVELVKAGAAVLGRYGGVDEPELVGGLEDVLREATIAIALGGNRRDALTREALGGLD